MQYVSTRAGAPARDFTAVLLAGLAEDGGLFVPVRWPQFPTDALQAMRAMRYPELAAALLRPFVGDMIAPETLAAMCEDAYAGFAHPAVCPLVQLDHDLWVQELFHGPTLAFKDMAMQLLGRLFDHVLGQTGQRITIVGATSGDTGSAAIEACRDRPNIDIVILHPEGRTSEVQRRQMTTVLADNVTNIAVDGSFDDCQDLVKAMFADAPFRREMNLSAVNSINWARVAAQIPYYFASALALGAPEREVAFAVPTGNFGNVLAGWAASRMGLRVAKFVVASNRNDILARFFDANDMSVRPVEPSLSPSMDIQVSSNFERLLFELLGRDGTATARTMAEFRQSGRMAVPEMAWQAAKAGFAGARLDDPGTLAEMAHWWRAAGYLADPHTAVALAGARAHRVPGVPTVVMATAAPAKFPDAVRAATGITPPLPARLADLYERKERLLRAPAELAPIQALVRAAARRN